MNNLLTSFANLLTTPLQKLHDFAAKGWWQSLIGLMVLGATGAVTDHYWGPDNAVSQAIHGAQISSTTP